MIKNWDRSIACVRLALRINHKIAKCTQNAPCGQHLHFNRLPVGFHHLSFVCFSYFIHFLINFSISSSSLLHNLHQVAKVNRTVCLLYHLCFLHCLRPSLRRFDSNLRMLQLTSCLCLSFILFPSFSHSVVMLAFNFIWMIVRLL